MAAKGLNWKGLRAGLNHEDVAVLVVGMPVRSKFFYRAKDGVARGPVCSTAPGPASWRRQPLYHREWRSALVSR